MISHGRMCSAVQLISRAVKLLFAGYMEFSRPKHTCIYIHHTTNLCDAHADAGGRVCRRSLVGRSITPGSMISRELKPFAESVSFSSTDSVQYVDTANAKSTRSEPMPGAATAATVSRHSARKLVPPLGAAACPAMDARDEGVGGRSLKKMAVSTNAPTARAACALFSVLRAAPVASAQARTTVRNL